MVGQLEQIIWDRADRCCEYCQLPAEVAETPFQIEHIIARKHGGQTSAENLALACFYCNIRKGPNLAGIDPDTGQLTRLYHPRTDRWSHHFRWQGPVLGGITDIGRTTIVALSINHPDHLAKRQALIEEGCFSPDQS